jgi:signal transduction histidine kinase
MVLQRDHLAETQVIDRRARRLLHDEVLPQLHAVLLSLGAAETVSPDALRRAVASLVAVHQEIAQLLRSTPPALAPEVARRGPIGALRQAIEVEFGGDFDGVVWDVDAEAERLARELPSTTAEVLFYAAREGIRNAARHARNGAVDRQLRLTIAARVDPDLTLVIEDDGVGLDADRSTGDSGGHGLALHTTMMAVVGGTLTTESVAGSHTRLLLRVPLGAIPVPGEATAASTSALPHHEASPSIALN